MDVYLSKNHISGILDHDGNTVGFFGVTPATRTTGIGQLTDSTGGTADDTLEDCTGLLTISVSAVENNFADLAAKLNTVMTALKNLGIIGD